MIDRAICEEIMWDIGMRLIAFQDLEELINVVVKVVFENDSEKAKQALLNESKRTMGQLLVGLRKTVEIDPAFDDCLKRTLEARNLFVHRLSSEFDLRSPSGAVEAINFLSKTMDDLEEVSKVLQAVVVDFGKQNGFLDSELADRWRQEGWLRSLETDYIPNLNRIFNNPK